MIHILRSDELVLDKRSRRHGFVRKENLDYAALAMILFWKRFLATPD